MTRAVPRFEMTIGVALGIYAASVVLIPSIWAKAALCLVLGLPLIWYLFSAPEHWLPLFLVSALVLPPLPVHAGNSGPHVAVLFALAGIWIGLLHPDAWRVRADPLAASLLALFGFLAISVAMAAVDSGLGIAAGSLARLILFGFSIYVLFFVRDGPCRVGWPLIRVLFWAACASAAFACVDFYYQFPTPAGYGPQFVWLDGGVFRRAQGVFYEASTLGNVCAFFLDMIAVAFFRPRSERPASTLAMIAGVSIFAAALVLSYSRASLVNLATSLLTLFWLYRRRFGIRRFVALAFVTALAACGLWLAFPTFAAAYSRRLLESFRYFSQSPNAVLSGRLANWRAIGGFLAAHPWNAILGVGFKTLAYSDFAGAAMPADNTYLSILAESGAGSLIALLALNVAILVKAYRAWRAPQPLRSFCGAWIFTFWCGQIVQMFSADLLTYWRALPVYFCVLAMAERNNDADSDSRPVR